MVLGSGCNLLAVYITHHSYTHLHTGLVPRTFGIMPEKAFKMQGWIIVGRFMESRFERPTISKWIVAGSVAGAATTIIGEEGREACVMFSAIIGRVTDRYYAELVL